MRLSAPTFTNDRRLFIVTLTLGLLGLLPAVYPILYVDGRPVTAFGWPDTGEAKLYIDILERYRAAYVPLYMLSVALVLVGAAGCISPRLVAIDYVFILVVAYTLTTIPLTSVASMGVPRVIEESVGGVLVATTFKSITYTPVYHMIRCYVLFLLGLTLSTGMGVYIILSKD